MRDAEGCEMSHTRAKSGKVRPSTPAKAQSNGPADPTIDVFTLAEAAAYLRVSEPEVVRLVQQQELPGRLLGSEWRFLKSAIQDWLKTPAPRGSREAVVSVIGAWKDDPYLEEELKEIYRKRGQPITEDGSRLGLKLADTIYS